MTEESGATADLQGSPIDDEDAGALNIRQRIQSVHEARARVRDMNHEITVRTIEGAVDDFAANSALRSALQNYLIEVEWLIREAGRTEVSEGNSEGEAVEDGGTEPKEVRLEREYWNEVDLGEMTFPNGRSEHFRGLRQILEAPDPFTVSTTEPVKDPIRGESSDTTQIDAQIPRHVLLKAFRQTNRFLAEIGLDIQLQPETVEASFDYSDLLENDEVPN